MHFGLTEEQDLLQETLRRFTSEVLPVSRLRECFDEGTGFDPALWEGAAEVGLPGLIVSEEYGGSGLEMLDLALAFEVLGEAAAPGPFLGHALVTIALSRCGDEKLKAKWLPKLASGKTVGGCALGEADRHWEPETWRLTEKSGRAQGEKKFAEVSLQSDLILLGLEGGRLGLVEAGAEGLSVEPIDRVDRTRALSHLRLDDVPIDVLPGDESNAQALMNAARILLAADAFGAAWRLIRLTVDYCQTREQFSTPIAQFQAVKHQLANMAKEAEPMRGLLWYAAYAYDHRPEEAAVEAATTKAHVTDRCVQIGRDAVSLHGGVGFTWECDVHFWLKRAMHDRVWLGSPATERERVAHLAGWSKPAVNAASPA